MKRFLKHFLFLLILIPAVLVIVFITRVAATYEVADQYGLITRSTTTEADGTVYMEKYDYDISAPRVTITYYENDTLLRTQTWELAQDDPLLMDTFEVLPHPTATAASTCAEDGTLYYFDADGNAEGYSELTYNRYDRLCAQRDYDAQGSLLRTTEREFATHTISRSDLTGK